MNKRALTLINKDKRRIMALVLLLVLAALSMTITPCAKTKKIKPVLNTKKATISIGETIQLSVLNGVKVKWSSSNKRVATVKGGVVTGKRKGTATITAKCGKLKAKCKVTVKKVIAPNSVALPDEVYKVVEGRWYTEASAIGCDAKFTRTKLTYYERGSHKVLKERNLIIVEKLTNGFYGLYKNQYKLTYRIDETNGIFFFISSEYEPFGERFDYFEDYFGDGRVSNSTGSSLFPK